jgi:hypothetical protein
MLAKAIVARRGQKNIARIARDQTQEELKTAKTFVRPSTLRQRRFVTNASCFRRPALGTDTSATLGRSCIQPHK